MSCADREPDRLAERLVAMPAPSPRPRPFAAVLDGAAPDLLRTMARRRTVKRLRPGPLPDEAFDRILTAVRLTPAAFNRTPWHLVILRERHHDFWDLVAGAVRDRLSGDRRERYLARVEGFRAGVFTALVYEDLTARDALQAAWDVTAEQARSYAEQGLGMVQLALWLAVTAEGLATSLQHLEWLIEDRAAAFLDLPPERYRLVATMPIGYAAEIPAPNERRARDDAVSYERFADLVPDSNDPTT